MFVVTLGVIFIGSYLVISLIEWIKWRNSFMCLIEKIPGPSGLPVIGNALDMRIDKVG
jgi:hypothetical protein